MTWNVLKPSNTSDWVCFENSLLSSVPTSQIPYLVAEPAIPASSSLNLGYNKTNYFYGVIPFLKGSIAGSLQSIQVLAAIPNETNLMTPNSICLLSKCTARLNPFLVTKLIFCVWNRSLKTLEQWCPRDVRGVSCAAIGSDLSISGHAFDTMQYAIFESIDLAAKSHPWASVVKSCMPSATVKSTDVKHYNWSGPERAIPRPACVFSQSRFMPDTGHPEIIRTSSFSTASWGLEYTKWIDTSLFYNMKGQSGVITASRFVRYQESGQADIDIGCSMDAWDWIYDHFSLIDFQSILGA